MKIHIAILLVSNFSAYSNVSADSNSTPQVIVSCGESKGYTYYHSNALIPKEDAGWTEDKVTDGSFFIEKSGEDYDLLFRDKLGFRSAKDDGAVIVPTISNETSLNLVVIYPDNGTTEVYNIQHIGSENVEASWTSTKAGTLLVKSGVFYTRCRN